MFQRKRPIACLLLLIALREFEARSAPGALVDRVAVVIGDDVITAREIIELEAYLRYRRDHSKSAAAKDTTGRLMREAYEEAITRKLVEQKLKSDPEFRLARGRARQSVESSIQDEGAIAVHARLEPYNLALERFSEMESWTVAIQDYVRSKLRYAIVPTAVQIQQYIERYPELKTRMENLSDEGKDEVRSRIAQQLEFENYLVQYKKFIDELRAEVVVTEVFVPEAP